MRTVDSVRDRVVMLLLSMVLLVTVVAGAGAIGATSLTEDVDEGQVDDLDDFGFLGQFDAAWSLGRTLGNSGSLAAPATVASLAKLYETHPDATLVSGATDVGLWITKELRDLPKIVWLATAGSIATRHVMNSRPPATKISLPGVYSHRKRALVEMLSARDWYWTSADTNIRGVSV